MRLKLYLCKSAVLIAVTLLAPAIYPLTVLANDAFEVRFEQTDNSAGGELLDGFVTTDIRIDEISAQWSGSQILMTLDAGSIYRDPNGNANGREPNRGLFPTFPSLEFDTAFYFSVPGGGAVDLGGDAGAEYPVTTTAAPLTLNQTWNPNGLFSPATDIPIARFTLSDDAVGEFSYLNVFGGEIFRLQGKVVNGKLVPEPSGLVLLISAGAVLLRRR